MIRVSNLSKQFKVIQRSPGKNNVIHDLINPHFHIIHAVDAISFSLQPGELIGYLGPNGAGKSTTIKILTGLLVPSSGEVLVNGFIPWRDRKKYVAGIGAVFGQRVTLWWDLPVIDSFEVLQAMYRIPLQTYTENLNHFRKILELDSFINTPVRSLSLGQRMRAELCGALLHQPLIVFLDEPTIGLDVVAKERIREFIRHINQKWGTTIILTTHDLTDVEKLCERVIILDQGKLLFDGGLTNLTKKYEGNHQLRVSFSENGIYPSFPGIDPPVREGQHLVYSFNPNEIEVTDLLNQLQQNRTILDLEIHRPKLEDTIRKIYEEKLLLP